MAEQIDWAYAWQIAGMSVATVFVLLVLLIIVVKLQGAVMSCLNKKTPTAAPAPAQANVNAKTSEAEMAAIAMALQLHYNSHDEVPGMLHVSPAQAGDTPWCAKNLGMNKLK